MQRGTGPTPQPGMSVPPTTSRWRKRIRGTTWLSVAFAIATLFGGDLLRALDDDADKAEQAALARVLLSPADLGEGWAEDEAEDIDSVTIGLTDGEAECLGIDARQPDVERGSSYFTRGTTTIAAHAGVWRDEAAARSLHDTMAGPAYSSCLVAQLQDEAKEGGDREHQADVSLLGTGPAAADATVLRFSVLYGWPDGSLETYETYQAFKGRTQVVVFTWTPSGVDQAFAVELVRKMLARVG